MTIEKRLNSIAQIAAAISHMAHSSPLPYQEIAYYADTVALIASPAPTFLEDSAAQIENIVAEARKICAGTLKARRKRKK